MSTTLDRRQSLGEEIANAASHAVGLAAAITACPFLIIRAVRHGDAAAVVGASVFAATTIALYLSSTLYHSIPHTRAKQILRAIDHGAIYLLIAGTYTPFTLGVLRGGWGWTLFGLIWGFAIAGVTFKALGGMRFPRASTCIYVGMGWLVIIALQPLVTRVPPLGLLWLFLGGAAYTGGVAFYAARRLRYAHFVWHLFVLAGTVCHFFAVHWYAAA